MTRSLVPYVVMVALISSAHAQEMSKVGSKLEVESWRCTATSERSIECINIGRVCEKKRNDYEAWSKTWFGCAVKGTHCPTDQEEKQHPHPPEYCTPMLFGGY